MMTQPHGQSKSQTSHSNQALIRISVDIAQADAGAAINTERSEHDEREVNAQPGGPLVSGPARISSYPEIRSKSRRPNPSPVRTLLDSTPVERDPLQGLIAARILLLDIRSRNESTTELIVRCVLRWSFGRFGACLLSLLVSNGTGIRRVQFNEPQADKERENTNVRLPPHWRYGQTQR